jgi:iron complex transport system substrate-binding protein
MKVCLDPGNGRFTPSSSVEIGGCFMKKSRIGLAIGVSALSLALIACGAPESEVEPSASTGSSLGTNVPSVDQSSTSEPGVYATVEAANGSVSIVARPEAIISLSPSATEMLFAVGAGDQVIAVDEFSYFPAEAPVTDLSGFTPNLESIGALDPDLVVVSNDTDGIVGALNEVGITVLLLPAAVTFDEVYSQMLTLGAATGHDDEASDVASELEREIESAITDAGDLADGLTVYHELDNTLYSITSQTFIGLVYESFGLSNIADAADADGFGYPQLSAEYVIDANPDLIFLTDCCGDTAESVAARPGWDNISAVRNGAVTVVDADVSSRWGPRLVLFFRSVSNAIVGLNG